MSADPALDFSACLQEFQRSLQLCGTLPDASFACAPTLRRDELVARLAARDLRLALQQSAEKESSDCVELVDGADLLSEYVLVPSRSALLEQSALAAQNGSVPFGCVLFLAERRQDPAVYERLRVAFAELEDSLHNDIKASPSVYAYVVLRIPGTRNYCNLVLVNPELLPDRLMQALPGSASHAKGIRELSQVGYTSIRIHAGTIAGCFLEGSATLQMLRTRLLCYSEDKPYRAVSRHIVPRTCSLALFTTPQESVRLEALITANEVGALQAGQKVRFASFLAANAKPWIARTLRYLSAVTGIAIEFVDLEETTTLEQALEAGVVDGAFACGLPFAALGDSMVALAAPCRAEQEQEQEQEQEGQQPLPCYYSEFLVAADSEYQSVEDLQRGVWAFNERRSWSGYVAPSAYLRARFGCSAEDFFCKSQATGAHLRSLEAVLSGAASCTVMDSMVFAMELQRRPELRGKFRSLFKLGPFPAPPVVLSTKVAPWKQVALSRGLLEMHGKQVGQTLLRDFGFARFAAVTEAQYAKFAVVARSLSAQQKQRFEERGKRNEAQERRGRPARDERDTLPFGFEWLPSEPEFDPKIHLQLEKPRDVVTLEELGYSAEEIAQRPSKLGATAMFRLLSDEGVRVARQIVAQLERYAVSSPRIPRVLRGATFRSRWLRSLMESKEVKAFLTELAGTPIDTHPMRIHGMHTNLTPPKEAAATALKAVDAWHVDTTPFVYVLYTEDPASYEGGLFQYFKGTYEEGRQLLRRDGQLPEDRVASPAVPAAGYAIFQQGCMVMHRATAVTRGTRTSLVQSYYERSVLCEREACTKLAQTYNSIDPLHVLLPEWAGARVWKAARRMEEVLKTDKSDAAQLLYRRFDGLRFPYTDDRRYLSGLLVDSLKDFHIMMPRQSAALRGEMMNIFQELQSAAVDIITLKDSSMEYF